MRTVLTTTFVVALTACSSPAPIINSNPTPGDTKRLCNAMRDFSFAISEARDTGVAREDVQQVVMSRTTEKPEVVYKLSKLMVDLTYDNPSIGRYALAEKFEDVCLKNIVSRY